MRRASCRGAGDSATVASSASSGSARNGPMPPPRPAQGPGQGSGTQTCQPAAGVMGACSHSLALAASQPSNSRRTWPSSYARPTPHHAPHPVRLPTHLQRAPAPAPPPRAAAGSRWSAPPTPGGGRRRRRARWRWPARRGSGGQWAAPAAMVGRKGAGEAAVGAARSSSGRWKGKCARPSGLQPPGMLATHKHCPTPAPGAPAWPCARRQAIRAGTGRPAGRRPQTSRRGSAPARKGELDGGRQARVPAATCTTMQKWPRS